MTPTTRWPFCYNINIETGTSNDKITAFPQKTDIKVYVDTNDDDNKDRCKDILLPDKISYKNRWMVLWVHYYHSLSCKTFKHFPFIWIAIFRADSSQYSSCQSRKWFCNIFFLIKIHRLIWNKRNDILQWIFIMFSNGNYRHWISVFYHCTVHSQFSR